MSITYEELKALQANLLKARQAHSVFLKHTQAPTIKEQLIIDESEKSLTQLEKIIKKGMSSEKPLDSNGLLKELEHFLSARWKMIGGSFLSYTSMPQGYMNELCESLAMLLAKKDNKKKRMQYLMPSLKHITDLMAVDGEPIDIDSYKLSEVILSDNQEALIPANLISYLTTDANGVSFSILGKPYHGHGEKLTTATDDEQRRLIAHSTSSQEFFRLYTLIHDLKEKSLSLGGELHRLIQALRRGGETGGQGGTEMMAGIDALLGIKQFMVYWNGLSQDEREKFGNLKASNETKSIQEIVDIFTKKDETSLDCVEVNASALEEILKSHPNLYKQGNSSKGYIESLQKEFASVKQNLQKNAAGSDDLPLTYHFFKSLGKLNVIFSIGLHHAYKNLTKTFGMTKQEATELISDFVQSSDCTKDIMLKVNSDGRNALMWAVSKGILKVTKAILESNYCDNALLRQLTKFRSRNALMIAAENRDIEIVKAILESKHCDKQVLNQVDKFNSNALMIAAENGDTDIVKAILESKHCDKQVLNQVDKFNSNALMIAAKGGHTEIVKAILESKHCDKQVLNQVDKFDSNALMIAAESGDIEIVKAILESKYCDKQVLNQVDNNGWNVLLLAMDRFHDVILKAVLESEHCDKQVLNHTIENGWNVLMFEAQYGNTEIVKAILESEHCDIDLMNNESDDGENVFKVTSNPEIKQLLDEKYKLLQMGQKKISTTQHSLFSSSTKEPSKGSEKDFGSKKYP